MSILYYLSNVNKDWRKNIKILHKPLHITGYSSGRCFLKMDAARCEARYPPAGIKKLFIVLVL